MSRGPPDGRESLTAMLDTSPPPAVAPDAAAVAGELFVVIFEPGPGWRAGEPMARQDLRAHGAYHADLVRRGRAAAAGGFLDRDGGMAILRAGNAAEAQAVVEADPAIRNGVFTAEVRRWRPLFFSDRPLVEAPAGAP